MFKNYLKIAVRNLFNQKVYSFINIFGLAFGLAACILVGLYILQEFSYDNYHTDAENIYRLSSRMNHANGSTHSAETPALTAPVLTDVFPEIEKISRIYFSGENMVTYGKLKLYEENIVFADPDFFQIFSYEQISGDPAEFLQRENTIIITRSMAEKYFGKEEAVGRVLNLDNEFDLEITGVIEDVPVNSHFTFDMVATYKTLEDMPVGIYLDQWGATFGSYTYIRTRDGSDIEGLEKKISSFLAGQMDLLDGVTNDAVLQRIEDIHLYSNLHDEIRSNSSIRYIMILGSISLFILLLACINFINLTTARAIKRAREIGVRKVFGAYKKQLVAQFLGESILITILALLLALILVELILPFFNEMTGIELAVNYFKNVQLLVIIILSAGLIGALAGLYPSLFLSRYNPIKAMKGGEIRVGDGQSRGYLRKGLVLFQFCVSIILIIFTIIISQQVNFLRGFDMGFNKDEILTLKTPVRMSYNSETIKQELNSIPGVLGTSCSLGAPVLDRGFGTNLIPDLGQEDDSFMISVKMIDHEYLDFYGIELVAGQRLSDLEGADYSNFTMVNEATVRKLGFSSPEAALGNAYTIGLSDGVARFSPEIIGVVKDFHYKSLHEEVLPLLFMHWPFLFQEISIKVTTGNLTETMKDIEDVWDKFYPEHPFTYNFLDDKIDNLYKAEERSFKIITTFSILAILIACLGLLGLTMYTVEQRRKEIGIRKILGATIPSIFSSISAESVKLVLISNLIAWPVSYFLIKEWLSDFPYKIEINITIFILAGVIALLISILTIGYIVIRSASANPIRSIRYE